MSEWKCEVVKLGKVEPLPNSDFLEITTVWNEYPVIFRKGDYKEGQLVSFLSYDTVVPDTQEFHFLAPAPKKDKDGNIKSETPPVGQVPEKYRYIKAKLLRGSYSEGLLMPCPPGFVEGQSVVDYYGLTQRIYLEEVEEKTRVKGISRFQSGVEVGPKSIKLSKYDLEPLAKYSNHLEEGEHVIICEKLEGENCTLMYAENRLWVKSRNQWKSNEPFGYERNFFKRTWKKFVKFLGLAKPDMKRAHSYWYEIPIEFNLENKLKNYPNLAIIGELYGGISPWHYDCEVVDGIRKRRFRVFDIYDAKKKKFLEWSDVVRITSDIGLETVPVLYEGPWKSDRTLNEFAEGASILGGCPCKEGMVIRTVPESSSRGLGRRILKLKGRDYKLTKG